MPKRVEIMAVEFAERYLTGLGYSVTNVMHKRRNQKQFRGYDLLATRGPKKLRIEVKGCTRPWGIPDPYLTEFDSKRRLVADFLYVVYFIGRKRPKLCIIPRRAIPAELVLPKRGYRISGRFKNRRTLEKFVARV